MVDAISSASSLQTNAAKSSATLSDNFDTFLTLLTAQLQNQDPLEPVDSTEFTNQLVQFSGVEQQIQTNSALGDLIRLTTSSTAAGLAGYLGKSVEIDSPTAELSGDGIEWLYNLPEGVEKAVMSVQSEDGRIVYSKDVSSTDAGEYTFNWDGELSSCNIAESGEFKLIVRAENANEQAFTVSPRVRTTVNGVDLSSGSTSLTTSSGVFDFANVLRLMNLS